MINRFDQDLREVIECILHLPQCVTSGLTFRSKRIGGIDVPKLETGRQRSGTQTYLECRKFEVQLVTLGHILVQCTYTKEQKNIRCYGTTDLIRGKVTNNEKVAVTTRKPGISSPYGKFPIPDLVIKN
jgi:hypothetical protein